jgi:hypothetical protein
VLYVTIIETAWPLPVMTVLSLSGGGGGGGSSQMVWAIATLTQNGQY